MAAEPLGLVAVGLSHHTAPVVIRERFALDEAGVRAELDHLHSAGLVREALLLATCNRVELYAVPGARGVEAIREDLLRRRSALIGEPADRYLYWRDGVEAVRHLFRVACSLDSLVLGEPQVLGQVKNAVRVADEAGSLGTVLNRLTQRGLWVAKHVRTHTEIGRGNVGVGNAGVHLAQQIFSTLNGRRALLIGTGEMGQEVAKAMVGTGLDELMVTSRTFSNAVAVAEEFGGTALPFERLQEYLQRADIVICATGAIKPILDGAAVRAALKARRYKPLFLVDLSVPRNIDPEVESIDQAYLFNIDDLTQVMERNRAARESAAKEAEALVNREAERFASRFSDLSIHDGIGRLVRKAEALRQDELSRTHRVLEHLTDDDRATIDAMTKALVKKLLHSPLETIREANRRGDEDTLAILMRAWHVEGEPLDADPTPSDTDS